MYLQKPKLRYCLFLLDNDKKKINQTMCMAESYEIQYDGSIIFYQIGIKNEKQMKVPVLAYPSGKWEACILVDDNNDYPVFSHTSHFSAPPVPMQAVQSVAQNNSQNTKQSVKQNIVSNDDFDDLDSFSNSENNQNNSNQSTTTNNNVNNNVNFSVPGMIPGVSQMNNPQEYKKMKSEWLEKHIIDFSKTQDFNIIQFMQHISNDSQLKTFKPTENDIIWAAASLIQDRMVLHRKFSNPHIQKQFDFVDLRGIMKRFWDGKLTPILTTLQEKEETKDANAIDLAVWIAKNNYN